MAEPLKNLLHRGLVEDMADRLVACAAGFDRRQFIRLAADDMENLELMQRSLQIRDALAETLPADFAQAAALLEACLPADRPGLSGWALLPVSQYVAAHGLGHFDLSLALLKRLTPHFTGEFGIRPFIHADQERALATIGQWVADGNHHVRRLASEGTRPRLPWAMRLPALMRDPEPILPILTALLDDPEDYVRRSVANSLNDIAKDHPQLVAGYVAHAIPDASSERRQLLRHASRTLLKQGNAQALANFGFGPAPGLGAELGIEPAQVTFGGHLALALRLTNQSDEALQVMVDYAVHHRKANGMLSPKVFKWKNLVLAKGEVALLTRRHALRPITTRQYYPGQHRVDILVNGTALASGEFSLVMP